MLSNARAYSILKIVSLNIATMLNILVMLQELINRRSFGGGCCGTTPEHISYIKESVKI